MNVAKFGAGEPETLEAFASKYGLTLEVKERSSRDSLPRWHASFASVDVVTERGTLRSEFGQGATPDDAAGAYARCLAGCRVVLHPYTPRRVEVDVPNDFRHVARPG